MNKQRFFYITKKKKKPSSILCFLTTGSENQSAIEHKGRLNLKSDLLKQWWQWKYKNCIQLS